MRIGIIFKNFLNTLRRYFTSSLLNILGLAVAFACLYVILVQVYYDFTYNRSFKDGENIYRLECNSWYSPGKYQCWLNRSIPERLLKEIPQIRVGGAGFLFTEDNDITIRQGEDLRRLEVKATTITSPLLEVFGFQPLEGKLGDMERPKTVIISGSLAKKTGLKTGDLLYMGKEAPSDKTVATIAGVFKDFPGNTDLAGVEMISDIGEKDMNVPSQWNYNYYLKLGSANEKEEVGRKITELMRKYYREEGSTEEEIDKLMKRYGMSIRPVKDTYFSPEVENPPGRTGNKTTSYTLLGIALLVVAIAFINFINFFFALVPVRIRSVNTFKIFGSSPSSLRLNFIFETLGLVCIALLISWCLIALVGDKIISQYVSAPLELSRNLPVFAITVGMALALAVISTIYPAYYITSFSPAFVIKGSFGSSRQGKNLRYALVGIQFVISISLIIASLFMRFQYTYMMNYDMGFDKENLLSAWVSNKIAKENRDAFTNKLLTHPQIKAVAYAAGDMVAASRMGWGRGFKGEQINFQSYPVSYDFLELMGIKIIEGRNFTKADELKENGTLIFNDKARKDFGLTLEDKVNGHNGLADIAGFCEDFNFKPLRYGIAPFAFYVFGRSPWSIPRHVYIRTGEHADIEQVMQYIVSSIMEFDPKTEPEDISVRFFDQELDGRYRQEKKVSLLITVFTILSIIISLMGVFGLVLFETQYRRKEIGLRRVHGASVNEILMMFNSKFIKIVTICFIIAVPVSWYAVNTWLSGFAYRVPLYWWVFAIAFVIVLAVTVSIVTLKSLRAAYENPSNSIRTE